MGWDDIDFDLIVTGAVTVDINSEQNYYNILNMFGIALDERVNVITTSQNSLPTLPGIRFNIEGEIRAGVTFMEKYRDLLQGYFDIWNDFDWYAPDALTDPLNFDNYLLDDNDLETAMGANAFDLLINRASKNRVELWSADLFNGLYELYKLTQVTLKQLGRTRFYSTTLYNQPMFFSTDDQRLVQQGGSNADSFDTYEEAEANYESNKVAGIFSVGNTTIAKICFYGQRVRRSHQALNWNYSAFSSDTIPITIKALDLLGNNLSMDIVGTGVDVIENHIETTVAQGIPTYATPEAGFPFVGPNDLPITVALEANSVTLDATRGLRYEYFLYGTPTTQAFPPVLTPSFAGDQSLPGGGTFEVEFDLAIHKSFLIDVNNSGLEFFIEEE